MIINVKILQESENEMVLTESFKEILRRIYFEKFPEIDFNSILKSKKNESDENGIMDLLKGMEN